MKLLFIIGILAFVQGIFQLFLLQTVIRKRNSRFLFLFFILLISSVSVLEYALIWGDSMSFFPHLLGLSFVFQFLLFPLLYLFFVPENRSAHRVLVHFIPFVLIFFYQLPYLMSSQTMKMDFYHAEIVNGHFYTSVQNVLVTVLFIIQGGIYIYFISKRPQENNWLTRLRHAFIVYYLTIAVYGIILFVSKSYVSVICAVLIFVLAGIIYYTSFLLFVNIKTIIPQAKRYSGSRLSQARIKEILDALDKLEHKNSFYKNSQLRLPQLAELLEVSSHELSQALNQGLKTSFNTYLNRLRVSHAERLMADTDETLSLKEISFDAGFNNKTSFINAFKKKHHMTPTAYRELLQQNRQQL